MDSAGPRLGIGEIAIGDEIVHDEIFGVGRVAAIEGDRVTLDVRGGEPQTIAAASIRRRVVGADDARSIVERLAVRGDATAALPTTPGDTTVPKDQRLQTFHERERSRPPLEVVDDVRNALAAPPVGTKDRERADARLVLGGWVASRLYVELGWVLERPSVAIELGVASAGRGAAPRDFERHLYVGSFETKGPLVIADVPYLRARGKPMLQAKLEGKKGRWHAWIALAPGSTGKSEALLVVHESALEQATSPTRQVATVGNDAGMIGVFDGAAVADKPFETWLRSQPVWVQGIVEGRGVLVRTEGDGTWDVRAALDGERAIVIRIPLAYGRSGGDPIAAAGAAPVPERTYSPRERFAAGDIVVHAKFGRGQVSASSKDTIEVAFPDATRTLVHGR
jgi:hypothetical protein